MPALCSFFALYGRHGNRHVLQALRALLRGHDNLFKLLAVSQRCCGKYGECRDQWSLAEMESHEVALFVSCYKNYGWRSAAPVTHGS